MLDLLTHLYATYTVIYNANWLENDKRFREPYSSSVLIEVAWQQIDDAVSCADAGLTPYSNKKVVDNSYQLVFNTVIFAENCREWNQRMSDNKTLPHLKTLFAAMHREWRLSLQNETGTPYSAAHNVTARPDDGYLQQETVDAIANLSTATASDRAAISHLTSTVESLTTELVTVNTNLVATLKNQ